MTCIVISHKTVKVNGIFEFSNDVESGSSYASPVVATTIWLRQLLLHGAGKLAVDRNDVARASRPPYVGPKLSSISAGGAFKPEAALIPEVSHVINKKGYSRLDNCSIEIKFDSKNAGPGLVMNSESKIEDRGTITSIEFAPLNCGKDKTRMCYWSRYWLNEEIPKVIEDENIDSLGLSYSIEELDSQVEIISLNELSENVNFISCMYGRGV